MKNIKTYKAFYENNDVKNQLEMFITIFKKKKNNEKYQNIQNI